MMNEDQTTSEFKVKKYVDGNGVTRTRKVRPHKVHFKNSGANAEPNTDDTVDDKEDMKKEELQLTSFAEFHEGWDDMIKAAKERNKPQPNGGAGKKEGTRYGGSKQKTEELSGDQHKLDKNKNGKLDKHDFKMLRKEEAVEEQAPVAPSIGVHRIGVTVSEPDHPAVSQRKEKKQKFVRVTAHDKDKAVEQGKKHFAKKGYKVHGAEHVGMVHEEVEQVEEEHKYVVKYHNPKSEKHGSTSAPLSQAAAHKKAEMGNNVDKTGGKYTVHKMNAKGHISEAAEPPFDGPYKKSSGDGTVTDKSGAKHTPMSHAKDLARKALKQQMDKKKQANESVETEVVEEKMTDDEMKKREDIVKGMKKSYKDFVSRYGDKAKNVMYATATKMAQDK